MTELDAAIEAYKAKRKALGEEFKPDLVEERDRYKADLDSLRSQLREEVEELRGWALIGGNRVADRLSKLLSEEGKP